MSRRQDWSPLCEGDPVPGDPHDVERVGRHYEAMSHEIEAQVGRLRAIAAGEGLEGDYVKTFTETSEKLAGDLAKTSGRYREVGGALKGWGPELEGYQQDADGLYTKAVEANGRVAQNAAHAVVTGSNNPPPTPEEVAAEKARSNAYQDATGDLSRIRGDLDDLKDRRDGAAGKVADTIRDRSDDDVKDSWWDNFKDWMDSNAGWISTVTKVLGYIGLACMVIALFVPGLNIVAAIGLGVMAASLVGHTALAASGNGSWVDVGLDVLSLATMGTGKLFATGFKIGSRSFGGALKAAQLETRTAGSIARGQQAVRATRTEATERIAAIRRGMPARSSGRMSEIRAAERRIANVRRDLARNTGSVREMSRAAYRSGPPSDAGTALSRLTRGGTEPGVANLRTDIARVAKDFPNNARVQAAAAKGHFPGMVAAGGYGSASAIGTAGSATDTFKIKSYEDFKDRFVRQIGSTW